MIYGSVYGSGYGDPENMVESFNYEESSRSVGALRYSFTPAANFGDAFFGVYIDSVMVDEVYAEEDAKVDFRSVPSSGDGEHSFLILRHGNISNYPMPRVARALDTTTAKKTTLWWTWPYEIIGSFDSGGEANPDLSSWSLTGLTPLNMEKGLCVTRNRLTFDMATDGDTTITLYCNKGAVATGTVTAPGTLTLAEANDSGISGTVVVGAAPTDATDSILHVRWPEYMSILRGTASPPTVAVDSFYFVGELESLWTEPVALTPTTYYYKLRPYSDTGDVGTDSAVITIILPAPPVAPSALAYASGNAAETVLSFTPSTTVGATYRLYLKKIADVYMNLVTVAATAAAEAEAITLPAITGYAGTVRVILRAINGGVEEKNTVELDLEYDAAGAFVPARPPVPGIVDYSVASGLTVSIDGSVSTFEGLATPATLQLFLRDADGSYDFANPDDTTALAVGTPSTNYTATVEAAVGATGWKYATLKTATAAGTQSENYADEVLIYVSDVNVAAPAVTGYISRG